MKNNQPIGFFDSGIGGLTVANAVLKALPNEQIVYYGDSLHFPYGEKSPNEIIDYSIKISDFLLKNHQCKCIIIACNTASASAFESVKSYVGHQALVINVIEPTVYYIQKHLAQIKSIGIIATRGTIKSNAYQTQLQKNIPHLLTQGLATPLLAPMIEEGFINDEVSQSVIKQYLSHPTLHNIEALILACTHYPLIKDEIEQYYNDAVPVLDTPTVVAEYLTDTLQTNNLLNSQPQNQDNHQFYVSEHTETIEANVQKLFKYNYHLIEHSVF